MVTQSPSAKIRLRARLREPVFIFTLIRHATWGLGVSLILLNAPAVNAATSAHPASAAQSTRPAVSNGISKSDLLQRLKIMLAKQAAEIEGHDDLVRKRVVDTRLISLRDEPNIADHRLTTIIAQIDGAGNDRDEALARLEFLNRLALVVESKWSGQPLRTFLETQFREMALNDLTNPQGTRETWKFMIYLSIVVRELPEANDLTLNLVENYMTFAGVLNPRTPIDFFAARNYTSAGVAAEAQPMDRANAGDQLEKRLKTINSNLTIPVSIEQLPNANELRQQLKSLLPSSAEPPAMGLDARPSSPGQN